MELGQIFKKTSSKISGKTYGKLNSRPEVPEGLMMKCKSCGKAVFHEQVVVNGYICPKCGGYQRMPADARLMNMIDPGSFEEWDTGIENKNPLLLKSYPDKIAKLKQDTGLDEAVLSGRAKIKGQDLVLMIMDCRFLTASMGQVVGEKITRGVERATELSLPVVIFCCSGGARMQEGCHSLMQMAKTSAALKRHSDKGLLYISVLTNPTTGGVTASFAMLGDIILAEPDALVGFAGPRVIEQTIRQKLPKGFQRSEFVLEHGFIDRIVKREDMREEIGALLALHEKTNSDPYSALLHDLETGLDCSTIRLDQLGLQERSKKKKAWDRVELSRQKDRPVAGDYIMYLLDDFKEFHGDRNFGDDPSIIGGVGYFHGVPVTLIAHQKGKDTKENIACNFGMPNPEGYRKALRLMKQAEKFGRPVICLVDTPGAYPGIEAEERGQGAAIAENLYELSALKVPVLSLVIGEGGSGGALALAVSDEVWMMENAIYSILSPEGYASILWKDAALAKKAAKIMRLTSYDLYEDGIIDQILLEPDSFTEETMEEVIRDLEGRIIHFLVKQNKLNFEEIVENRYERFRRM